MTKGKGSYSKVSASKSSRKKSSSANKTQTTKKQKLNQKYAFAQKLIGSLFEDNGILFVTQYKDDIQPMSAEYLSDKTSSYMKIQYRDLQRMLGDGIIKFDKSVSKSIIEKNTPSEIHIFDNQFITRDSYGNETPIEIIPKTQYKLLPFRLTEKGKQIAKDYGYKR